MLNRRSLLKLVPAGFLGSLFPAKLFAKEKVVKKEYKPLYYEIDGHKIYETTFFYTKEELMKADRHIFAAIPSSWKEPGDETMVPHFFFNKDGEVLTRAECGYRHNQIKINSVSNNIPKQAVFPKHEWIKTQASAVVRQYIEYKNDITSNVDQLYVYIFLREDIPCVGIIVNNLPCKKAVYSLRII